MASLILNSNINKDADSQECSGFMVQRDSWGEYAQPDGNQLFRKFRNNFRNCQAIEGYIPQQKTVDYFLPKPLSHDFRNHITSFHNTKRKIKPPFSFHVIPEHDYNRTDNTGRFVLSQNTRTALNIKHDDLYRTSRYSKNFPDHSPFIFSTDEKGPSQHNTCNIPGSNLWKYKITRPPFEEIKPQSESSVPRISSIRPKSDKKASSFIEDLNNRKAVLDSDSITSHRIAQMHCKSLKYPMKSNKHNNHVRFSIPETRKSTSAPTENSQADQNVGLSYWREISPQQWPMLDCESRRICCLKNRQETRRSRLASTREHLYHYLELLRKRRMKASQEEQLGCIRSPDPHYEQDEGEEEEDEQGKFESEYSCKSEPMSSPRASNEFKVVHKFDSPLKSNLDPNYLCSKTESSKRYHALFPDIFPDQRENFTYGKRVNFMGFNSSIFRG